MTDTELLKQVGIGRIFLKPIVVKVFSPQPGSLDARGSWSCPQLGPHQRPAGGDRGRQLPQVEHLGRLAHIKHVFNNLNILPYLRLNIYSKLPHYTPFVTVNGKKVVEADVEATNGVIDHYECLLFPVINWTFQVIHFISDVIYPLPTTNTMADFLSTDERLEIVRKKMSRSKPQGSRPCGRP